MTLTETSQPAARYTPGPWDYDMDCAVEKARAGVTFATTTHPETMERKQP